MGGSGDLKRKGNESKVSRSDVESTITWAMTLTLNFQGEILKKLHLWGVGGGGGGGVTD